MSDGLIFHIKKNDLRPYLQVQLLNPDRTPRDLTGFTSLMFKMRKDDTLKVNSAATVVAIFDGIIEYRWATGDTDETGRYRAEFVVDGIDTYPKDGYITVDVVDDLD